MVYPEQLPTAAQVRVNINDNIPVEVQPDKSTLVLSPDKPVTIEFKQPTLMIELTSTTDISDQDITVVGEQDAIVRFINL